MTDWNQLIDEASTHALLRDLSADAGRAVVDVLTVIVHADDHVAFLEKSELLHMLAEMPWVEGKNHINGFIEDCLDRTRGRDSAEIAAEAARLLKDPDARRKVLEMAATLANVDFEVHETERAFVEALAEAFRVDTEALAEIQRRAGW